MQAAGVAGGGSLAASLFFCFSCFELVVLFFETVLFRDKRRGLHATTVATGTTRRLELLGDF